MKCLDETVLAAYADGGLEESSRETVEDHLAACPECRDQVVLLVKLRDSDGAVPPLEEVLDRCRQLVTTRRDRTPMYMGSWGFRAAAVLLVAIAAYLWLAQRAEAPGDSFRTHRTQQSTPGEFELLSPTNGSTVVRKSLLLRWRSLRDADHYEVTLADSAGQLLWEARTDQTSTPLPAGISLLPGERYFVSVTARLSTGRRVKSPFTEFSIAAEGKR